MQKVFHVYLDYWDLRNQKREALWRKSDKLTNDSAIRKRTGINPTKLPDKEISCSNRGFAAMQQL